MHYTQSYERLRVTVEVRVRVKVRVWVRVKVRVRIRVGAVQANAVSPAKCQARDVMCTHTPILKSELP